MCGRVEEGERNSRELSRLDGSKIRFVLSILSTVSFVHVGFDVALEEKENSFQLREPRAWEREGASERKKERERKGRTGW